MLKTIKIQFAMLMLLLLGWSCTSDLGNYSYNDINEIKGTGLESNYTVYYKDNLKIAPNLTSTMDDGSNPTRYTYQWIAIDPNPASTAPKTVIGTAKDFDDQIKLVPGKYKIYYFVKDSVTGITWQQAPFELNVVSSIYEGWLVLGDVAGKARLDMISVLPGVAAPVIINDVLEFAGSTLKLKGKAVDVHFFKNPVTTPMDGIYVTASESGTSRLEENTFAWAPTQNIAYEFNVPGFDANFAVDFMKAPNGVVGENLVYSKGNIYYWHKTLQKRYGLPMNLVSGETKTFVAAPFIAENGGSVGRAIFYDQGARRFIQFTANTGICNTIPNSTLLNWSNTNSDLVFMTTIDLNGYEALAILKNISTGKYNLLRINRNASNQTLTQTFYKEMLNATDIDKATKFAVSSSPQYLFYAVGGKLYEYDWGTQTSKLMLDKGSEEITFIDYRVNKDSLLDRLIVGSYNGTAGKLELFTVPSANGNLVLKNTYDGLCKIIDVTYRVR